LSILVGFKYVGCLESAASGRFDGDTIDVGVVGKVVFADCGPPGISGAIIVDRESAMKPRSLACVYK